jgi:hypothetical protein
MWPPMRTVRAPQLVSHTPRKPLTQLQLTADMFPTMRAPTATEIEVVQQQKAAVTQDFRYPKSLQPKQAARTSKKAKDAVVDIDVGGDDDDDDFVEVGFGERPMKENIAARCTTRTIMLSSPLPPDDVDGSRRCSTCQEMLPSSAFYNSSKHKYWCCRKCEQARLREYRKRVKERKLALRESEEATKPRVCSCCLKIVPTHKMAMRGEYAMVYCVTCDNRRRRRHVPKD